MISIRRSSVLALVPLALAFVGALGCTSPTSPSSSPAPESVQTAAQDLAQEKAPARPDGARPHGAPGPELLFVAALHHVDLDAGQRATVQTLLDGLRTDDKDHAPDRSAFTAVAEAVRAGNVDVTALAAKLEKAGPMNEERVASVVKAIDTLHATLTKAQRQTLVDAMTKKMDEMGPKEHGPRGEHAHGEHHGDKGPLGHVLEGLSLTSEQQASIDKALADARPAMPTEAEMKARFEAMHKEMAARLAAFVEDAFDAKAFVAPPSGDAMGPRAHAEHMLKELAAIVPILTPAQRETLAATLEKGPPMMPGARGAR